MPKKRVQEESAEVEGRLYNERAVRWSQAFIRADSGRVQNVQKQPMVCLEAWLSAPSSPSSVHPRVGGKVMGLKNREGGRTWAELLVGSS